MKDTDPASGWAVVAVGSNIQPEHHLKAALLWLMDRIEVTGVSRFYRTPALGRPNDPPFVNGAFRLVWEGSPHTLKNTVLRPCEAALGRTRGADPYAPRTLDLDITLYGQRVVDEPDMQIPDPDLGSRVFVAVPACEVWPDAQVPGTGRTLQQIANDMDMESMTFLEAFTMEMHALWKERIA